MEERRRTCGGRCPTPWTRVPTFLTRLPGSLTRPAHRVIGDYVPSDSFEGSLPTPDIRCGGPWQGWEESTGRGLDDVSHASALPVS